MRRGRCSRCRPPRRRRVLLLSFFVVKNRPRVKQTRNMEQKIFVMVVWMVVSLLVIVLFSAKLFEMFLSLLQWGNLHLNLKHTTEATKEQPYHGSGVRERFRGRGESPPPTEEGEGGILRFRGIYYVYLLFSFFFFFCRVVVVVVVVVLRRALCVCWGMMIFEFNSCLSRFLCALCGGFRRARRENSAAPLRYSRAEVLTNSFFSLSLCV